MTFASSRSQPQPVTDGTLGTCTCSCVPRWGNSEEGCFALLPRASPRDHAPAATGKLRGNVPFPGLLPFPASLPHSSTSASCNHLPQKQLAGDSGGSKQGGRGPYQLPPWKAWLQEWLGSGFKGCPAPNSALWLCPLLSSCPQAYVITLPARGGERSIP